MNPKEAFRNRYGRVQRSPSVRRTLDDATKLEAYLHRSSVFIPTSVPFLYIGGELMWGRRSSGAEFQILVATIRQSGKRHVRPFKECGSRVIEAAKEPLAELLTAVGRGARPEAQ